jgi:phosphohistidine phosphatase SixA
MPLLSFSLALIGHLAIAPAPAELRGEPLMAALQTGGYTVVLRHARTDRTFQEPMGAVPASRVQQRNLNDDGVRDARLMGIVFRKYAIPFSEIISSPMFRTMETAEYAVGPATPTMALRALPSGEAARRLIAAIPKAGTNRLLVTHHFVIETHVPGIKPGDIAESEAVVVRTAKDGGVELVGKILLADWRELAGPQSTAPAAAPPSGGPMPAHAAPFVYPDTPVGKLALEYVKAFSSGESARMQSFIESSLEADSARPLADRLAAFEKLYADLGPLHVVGVEGVTASELTLLIHAKPGMVRVTVKESVREAGRAASITFRYGGTHP